MISSNTPGTAPLGSLLVVDDEPQVLTALKDLLEDDYDVRIETSPRKALKLLEDDPRISVILSDQRMPEMPGDEFLTRAREVSAATRLLITGHADLKAVIRSINDGKVFGYISKPWEPTHLMLTIHKAVEYFEVTRELSQERALLHNLMNSLPDAVYFKDRAHRYLRINPAKAQALGVATPEAAVGRTEADFANAALAARIQEEEDEVFRSGRAIVDQIEMSRTANGAERWFSTTTAPILNERGEVQSIVSVARDITERERARLALAENERRYRSLYNRTPVMMLSMDAEGGLISVSDYWCEALGFAREEVIGRSAASLMTEESRVSFTSAVLPHLISSGQVLNAECQFVRKDGKTIDGLLSAVAEHDDAGAVTRSLSVVIDVTDKKALEGQLLQAQKMDAIGQLTGGIAHDFNNLLTIVIGNLDIMESELEGELRQSAATALQAAERGAALTHRLLAFSRKQALQPATIDINQMVRGMADMLRRTLGESVEVETALDAELWPALADKGQLENALLNLAINSRDAMPSGGKLTIETANAHLDEDYALRNPGLAAGDYVLIAVTDTGTGMSPEVIRRAVEPFFTTKEPGKGTGLGLSMIYGFVRQSEGHFRIYSEVGHGTTVRIYLRQAGERQPAVTAPLPTALPRGDETVLVLEDNTDMRALVVTQLTNLGYRVIEAADGPAARGIVAGEDPIDLVLMDVVTPGGIPARVLADEAMQARPGLKVLFTSGYTRTALLHQGRLDPTAQVLTKPYLKRDLAQRVRSVLDDDGDAAA